MPALMRAAKLQKRAAKHGRPVTAEPDGVAESAKRLSQSRDAAEAERAAGELLFTAAALARQAGVDPEQALQRWNEAFLEGAARESLPAGGTFR